MYTKKKSRIFQLSQLMTYSIDSLDVCFSVNSGDSLSSVDEQPKKRPCFVVDPNTSSSAQFLELFAELANHKRFDELCQLSLSHKDSFLAIMMNAFEASLINALLEYSTNNFNVDFHSLLKRIVNRLTNKQINDLNVDTLHKFVDIYMRNGKGIEIASAML